MGVSHVTLCGSTLKRRKVIPVVMPNGDRVGMHEGSAGELVMGKVDYHSTSPRPKGVPIRAMTVGVSAPRGIHTTRALRVSSAAVCNGLTSGVRTLGDRYAGGASKIRFTIATDTTVGTI